MTRKNVKRFCFLLCFLLWKHLLILKTVPDVASKILFWLPFLLLVDFRQCLPLPGCRRNPRKCIFHCRFSERFSELLRLSEHLFRAIDGYQEAGTSPLKRVSVRIFRLSLVSVLIEASKNFKFSFLHIGAHSESTGLILKSFKKIFLSWHNPFTYY